MPPKRFQRNKQPNETSVKGSTVIAEPIVEYDYMSSDFVQQTSDQKRSRDSLINSKKKLKLNEVTTREEGLKTAISQDNIGFQLLSKMGFKSGKGLGKSLNGISEPIHSTSSVIGNVRLGIGLNEEIKRKEDEIIFKQKEQEKELNETFQLYQREKIHHKIVFKACVRVSKVILSLDERNNIEEHDLWPPISEEKEEYHIVCEDGVEGNESDVNIAQEIVIQDQQKVAEVWELNSVHKQDSGIDVNIPGISTVDTGHVQQEIAPKVDKDDSNESNNVEKKEKLTFHDWMNMDKAWLMDRLEVSIIYLRQQHNYSLLNACSFEELDKIITVKEEVDQILDEYA